MPTAVTWNGTAYSIPATGELNWGSLSNFLIDLGNNAQTTNFQKITQRKITSTPTTLSATTDCIALVNVGSATTINLPAGSADLVFYIIDISGAAATNNITIDGNGSETIAGSTTYTITRNNGGVGIVWNDTDSDWEIFTEVHRGTFDATDGSASAPSFTNVGDLDTGMFFQAANAIGFSTGGTERVRIDSSGSVSIGSALAPAQDFHLQRTNTATILVESTNSNDEAQLRLVGGNTTGSSSIYFSGTQGGSDGRLFYDHSSESLRIHVNGSERARFASDGDVSIGGTTPQDKFEIEATSPILCLTDSAAANANGGIRWRDNADNIEAAITCNIDVGPQTLEFATNGTNRAVILGDGNFGLNVSAPANLFHMDANDAGEFAAFIDHSNATGQGLRVQIDSSSASQTVFEARSTSGSFTAFHVEAAGNTGVGTASPLGRFHVEDNTSDSRIIFDNTNALGTNESNEAQIRDNGTTKSAVMAANTANTSASCGAIRMQAGDGGSTYYLWVNSSGVLRISSTFGDIGGASTGSAV